MPSRKIVPLGQFMQVPLVHNAGQTAPSAAQRPLSPHSSGCSAPDPAQRRLPGLHSPEHSPAPPHTNGQRVPGSQVPMGLQVSGMSVRQRFWPGMHDPPHDPLEQRFWQAVSPTHAPFSLQVSGTSGLLGLQRLPPGTQLPVHSPLAVQTNSQRAAAHPGALGAAALGRLVGPAVLLARRAHAAAGAVGADRGARLLHRPAAAHRTLLDDLAGGRAAGGAHRAAGIAAVRGAPAPRPAGHGRVGARGNAGAAGATARAPPLPATEPPAPPERAGFTAAASVVPSRGDSQATRATAIVTSRQTRGARRLLAIIAVLPATARLYHVRAGRLTE